LFISKLSNDGGGVCAFSSSAFPGAAFYLSVERATSPDEAFLGAGACGGGGGE